MNNVTYHFPFSCIGNDIEDEGARMISEVLKSNSTLTNLNLRSDEKEQSKINK